MSVLFISLFPGAKNFKKPNHFNGRIIKIMASMFFGMILTRS
jgi:hypothetical protein